MASNDMAEAIRQLVQTKGLSEEQVFKTIEDAIKAAYKKKFGSNDNVVVKIEPEGAGLSVYSSKIIVDRDQMLEEDVEDFNPLIHIDINDAIKLNPDSEIGDELLIQIDPADFDRLSVQSAKQTTHQSFREIQKDSLYADYKDKVGEIIIGYYQRERNQTIYVDLGKVEGVLPRKFQSPRDNFSVNDRIKALISEVKKTNSGLQIVLSRTDAEFVKKIVEAEVPEIYDRIVEIEKIVREPGYRTKIAVSSVKEDVDPVGACVGLKGVRIQNIIRELEGEKIDILKYEEDPVRFIKNALSPAEVEDVYIMDSHTRTALAVVDDSQFSLAIGKQGLNVRLANRLTDWSIDVKTRAQFEEENPLEGRRAAAESLFESTEKKNLPVTEYTEISEHILEALKASNIVYASDYVSLSEEEKEEIDGLSNEDLDFLDSLFEGLDLSSPEASGEESASGSESGGQADSGNGEEYGDEEEVFECPDCGARITLDMTSCPNCGIGLSFEYEDEETEE